MNEISPEQLLSQIRTLGRELQTGPEGLPAARVESGFGALLESSLRSVNELQSTSSALKAGFVNGSSDKSLAEVMIASQKASMAFTAVTEVRNKLVTAYQDIMNMPV